MSLTEVQSQNAKWKTEKTEEERLLSDYQGLILLQKRERSGEMDTTYTEFTRPFLQLQPTKTEGVCAHASADPIFLGITNRKPQYTAVLDGFESTFHSLNIFTIKMLMKIAGGQSLNL